MKRNRKCIFEYTIFRFLLVGSICTGIDFIIYMLLSIYIGGTVSKTISMIISMTVNYFVNKHWSFASKNTVSKTIVKFIPTQCLNLLVNVTTNSIVLNYTGMRIVAFVVATLLAMSINYFLQKKWVFK